jgi:hypothetical protein
MRWEIAVHDVEISKYEIFKYIRYRHGKWVPVTTAWRVLRLRI